jgi:hypothetical protein
MLIKFELPLFIKLIKQIDWCVLSFLKKEALFKPTSQLRYTTETFKFLFHPHRIIQRGRGRLVA